MSLAIIEKQPQRPGGCAGIFFQLLDWNRRLARKKLFSKKLLPPARPVKRPDKKFVGDEKLPKAKLILIASENRESFRNGNMADADENLENGTRIPGLVARLMGLEAMPDTDHEKPRKTIDSEIYYDHGESGDYDRLDRNLCHGKPDSRPQKLQKTGGFFERKPVGAARFCRDVTHKSAVFCSRKQQHKLASPVKGPRLLSRGNQARLVVAATKILEHGLQSRTTSRRSITCDVVSLSETIASETAIDQNDSVIGSCRTCGGVVDFSKVKCGVKEVLGAHNNNASSQPSVDVDFDTRGKDRDSVERKYLSASDQIKRKQQYPRVNNPKAVSKSCSSWTLRRAELPMSRDNVVYGSKLCSTRRIDNATNEFMASMDYVGAKKKLNSCLSLKSPSKISTCNGGNTEGNFLGKSVVRKRRSNSGSSLMGNGTASNPNLIKQRNIQSVIVNKNEPQLLCCHPINRSSSNNEPQKTVGVDTFRSKDAGIFAFSSPVKNVSPSSVKDSSSRKSSEQIKRTEYAIQPKKLVLDANLDTLPSPRRKSILRWEELSNLLEEKIRELNSLGQDDVAINYTPGRSTNSILKKLISALNAGESAVQSTHFENYEIEEDNAMLYMKNAERTHGFDISQKFQAQTNVFNDVSMISNSDHPSPSSIFDSSFSFESCSVGSFNGGTDIKECKPSRGFMHKCDKTQLLDLDLELLDSATSVDSDNGLQSSVEEIFTSISAAFFSRMESYLSLSKEKVPISLQNFLFDCLVESMNTRFNHFSVFGYKMWSKLSIMFNKDKLFKDINDEIVSLMELAGKHLDGLAEQELSSSTISWVECEAEVSEMGVDMERVILQELVNEMIADLCVTSNPDFTLD